MFQLRRKFIFVVWTSFFSSETSAQSGLAARNFDWQHIRNFYLPKIYNFGTVVFGPKVLDFQPVICCRQKFLRLKFQKLKSMTP